MVHDKFTKSYSDELLIRAKNSRCKSHILDKLRLEKTAELVKYAIKNGLMAMLLAP